MHTTRKVFFFIMVVSDLEGRAREQERQSWMLGNFTFSLPGPGKLPVDCECSHFKTSISTFFPFSFSFSFWFPFLGYCEPALTPTSSEILTVSIKISTYTNGQVAQAKRRLATCWTARNRSLVPESWRFFFTPSCPDWSWGPLSLL